MLRPHHGPLDLQQAPLPPDALNNHPILEPLTILDSRVDSSIQPPTQLVLVQWTGLAPKDSTCEKWVDVCSAHHLEDKVIFPVADNVSANSRGRNEDPLPVTREERPRRNITRPRHLENYV